MNLAKVLKQKISPKLHKKLEEISYLSNKLNLSSYLVGGTVRDLFQDGLDRYDCDVTVSGGDVKPLAALLQSQWKCELQSYPAFLTHTLQFSDRTYLDIVTAREEKYSKPAALPVVIRGTLLADLLRRDFSINAMALSLNKNSWGELMDPLGGLMDLKNKKLKILHAKSFEEDPTRIFRAAKFLCRFGFRLKKETEAALKIAIQEKIIAKLSGDRIRLEIEKIIKEREPFPVFKQLKQWRALEQIDPKLKWFPSQIFRGDTKQSFKERAAFYLSLMLFGNSVERVKGALEKLHFEREVQDRVLENLNLARALEGGESVLKLPQKALEKSALLFLNYTVQHIGKQRNLKKRWQEYKKWIQCRPLLDGNTLIQLGFKSGPLFKEIFRRIQIHKYGGKLKNLNEEIRFVVDNFRRD